MPLNHFTHSFREGVAHQNFQEPSLFGKGKTADDYESGSRSAIAGGTTTLITFAPQQRSQPSLLSSLSATAALARGQCYTDYSFHLICANAGPLAISEFAALRARGISSLKIYMTYAALQLSDGEILDVLLAAREHGITTMVHAENGQVIDWMTRRLEEKRLFDPKYHAASHPPVAEVEGTYRIISLSEFIDVPILIVHVSSPEAAAHIAAAQRRGLPVYAETCPQYLFLTREDMATPGFEGAKCVCSPPLREAADREGIWRGLEDGTFTILSSDHCPFVYGDEVSGKRSVVTEEFPNGHFKHIPNGCPGVETRLAATLSAGRLPLQKFVELTAANPARLYGLYPRKGAFVPGESDADVVIWYPATDGAGAMEPVALTNEMLHHNCDYSPYEGKTFSQWPRYTILRGEVVWDRENGGVVGKKGYGEFLERGASSLKGPRSEKPWSVEDF